MSKIARLAWDELVKVTEGIWACGQDPRTELDRIASLGDDDYHLALHGYQLATGFARRQEAQRAAA